MMLVLAKLIVTAKRLDVYQGVVKVADDIGTDVLAMRVVAHDAQFSLAFEQPLFKRVLGRRRRPYS